MCIMCPLNKHRHGRECGIMGLEEHKKRIDEVVRLGARKVVPTGFGEPIIDKTLEQKIAYAKQYGLNTYIISNVSLLTRRRDAPLIEAALDVMRVSFQRMRPETYNVVIQNLGLNVSVSNMRAFLELRAAPVKKTPRIEASYLILSENESDREASREFCELRADATEICQPHNFGDGRDYRIRLDGRHLKSACGRPENGPLKIQWNREVIPCYYDCNNQSAYPVDSEAYRRWQVVGLWSVASPTNVWKAATGPFCLHRSIR